MGEAKRRKVALRMPREMTRQRSALLPDIVEASRRAFAKQGAAAFGVTERATALHEAGHAVAGASIAGLVPVSVSLGTSTMHDPAFGEVLQFGCCEYSPGSLFARDLDVRVDPPEDVIAVAMQRFAGQCAEFMCDREDYRDGSSIGEDMETQAVLVGLGEMRLGLSQANAPALVVLTRTITWQVLRANQAIIERIAAALIAKRSLDQTAMAELLTDVSASDQPGGAWVLSQARQLHPKLRRKCARGSFQNGGER